MGSKIKSQLLAGFFAVAAFVGIAFAATTTFTTLRVTGASTFAGVTASSMTVTGSQGLALGAVISTATAVPRAARTLAVNAAGEVYISTSATIASWVKIGGQ